MSKRDAIELEAFKNQVKEYFGSDDSDSDLEDVKVKQQEEDNSYWIKDNAKKWFTLSKPVTQHLVEKTIKYDVITHPDFLKRMNDPVLRAEIADYNFVSEATVFVELITNKITTTVNTDPAPRVELPAGIYTYQRDMFSWGLSPYDFSVDEYIDLSGHTKKIEDDISTFLSKKEDYHKNGLLWKRGILLAGPQGNGKTVLLENISKKFSGKARIIFGLEVLQRLKSLEPFLNDLPLIVIAEEFTNYNPSELLGYLDGEESIDGCLMIFTTNYPQHIPMNIVDRPGRIDSIYEVGLPDEATRAVYLQSKLGGTVSQKIIKQSAGLSIAYLRELIVASQVYEKPFEEVFEGFKVRKKQIEKYVEMRNLRNPDRVWAEKATPRKKKKKK